MPPPPPPTSNDHVICPICSRTFSRQSVLNVHTQMVHTNTKANMLLRPKPNFEVSQNVDDSVEDFLDGGSFFDDEWLLIFFVFWNRFQRVFQEGIRLCPVCLHKTFSSNLTAVDNLKNDERKACVCALKKTALNAFSHRLKWMRVRRAWTSFGPPTRFGIKRLSIWYQALKYPIVPWICRQFGWYN